MKPKKHSSSIKLFLSTAYYSPFTFLLLLILPLTTQSQSYRIYKGDTINHTDAKGMKQGVWKRYYENDTLFSITFFKNNKPLGITKTYYKMGKPEAEIKYSTDGRHASVIFLHENGKIKAKGFYVDQKKDSVWKYYSETDSLMSIDSWKAGVRNGKWKIFYDNGIVSEEFIYVNNKRQGPYKQFFKDGKLKLETTFKDDEYDGFTKMYRTNGKLWFSGIYKNGLREGSWEYFSEEGVKDSSEVYKSGALVPRQ